jgi:hypothetical protein
MVWNPPRAGDFPRKPFLPLPLFALFLASRHLSVAVIPHGITGLLYCPRSLFLLLSAKKQIESNH